MTATPLPVLAALIAVLAAPTVVSAQYKVTGQDGQVTYTDRPPPGVKAVPIGPAAAQRAAVAASGTVAPVTAGAVGPAGLVMADLPYDLRAVVLRFPVVLLAGDNCVPCDLGRSALRQRGIPFVERSVKTREDLAALRSQEGGAELPVLRVAAQRLVGFDGADWMATLDAAGYPKASALSTRYRAPLVTPLAPSVAVVRPFPAQGSAREPAPELAELPRPAPSPTPSPNAGSAPPGFRF